MKKTLLAVSLVLVVCAAAAVIGVGTGEARGEPLFLALRIEDGGHVIAQPKLLGETGRKVTMRLVDPDRPDRNKLSLELFPERAGNGYRVDLQLSLPNLERAKGELSLAHGEERTLMVSDPARPIAVKLMLMRVGSPEFETYMELYKRQHPPMS